MPASGWIKLHRSLIDHWVFNHGTKNWGDAWIDLLLMASHKTHKVSFRQELITVEKGQILTSLISLQKRWKRGRKWINNFLGSLEKDRMISQKRNTRNTVITICNYYSFQEILTDEVHTEVHIGNLQRDTRGTTINNGKNEKNIKTKIKNRSDFAETKSANLSLSVREIFDQWVKVMGKDPRRVKLTSQRRRMVEARLKEGYEVGTLKIAIDGLARTPWNMGINPQQKRYDDFKYFCGDGARVETMAENSVNPPGVGNIKSLAQSNAEANQTAETVKKLLNWDDNHDKK